VYRTAWELPMRSLIDMAADRGAFIDQSQSLNLFIENPNIGQLSSMYFYAWKKGLKTTYYLRSRPATRIAKATVDGTRPAPGAEARPDAQHGWTPTPPAATPREGRAPADDAAAVACSLENPESCEACQ
jgi:ribonucleoside-diphosphate reductase alpha chain